MTRYDKLNEELKVERERCQFFKQKIRHILDARNDLGKLTEAMNTAEWAIFDEYKKGGL